jgi:hypothetical protein
MDKIMHSGNISGSGNRNNQTGYNQNTSNGNYQGHHNINNQGSIHRYDHCLINITVNYHMPMGGYPASFNQPGMGPSWGPHMGPGWGPHMGPGWGPHMGPGWGPQMGPGWGPSHYASSPNSSEPSTPPPFPNNLYPEQPQNNAEVPSVTDNAAPIGQRDLTPEPAHEPRAPRTFERNQSAGSINPEQARGNTREELPPVPSVVRSVSRQGMDDPLPASEEQSAGRDANRGGDVYDLSNTVDNPQGKFKSKGSDSQKTQGKTDKEVLVPLTPDIPAEKRSREQVGVSLKPGLIFRRKLPSNPSKAGLAEILEDFPKTTAKSNTTKSNTTKSNTTKSKIWDEEKIANGIASGSINNGASTSGTSPEDSDNDEFFDAETYFSKED